MKTQQDIERRIEAIKADQKEYPKMKEYLEWMKNGLEWVLDQ